MAVNRLSSARRLRTTAAAVAVVSVATVMLVGSSGATADPEKPAADGKGVSAPAASVESLGSYTRVVGTTLSVPANGFTVASATCPSGQVVLGGGESNSSGTGLVVLTDSYPSDTTQWTVFVKNNSTTGSFTFTPYAICGS
jgi:hypothetical protein